MARTRTSATAPVVEIDAGAARALLRGHPWVWRAAVRKAPGSLACGAPVIVATRDLPFVAHALWDPDSPIAMRVYGCDESRPLDAAAIGALVRASIGARDRLFDLSSTNAFRLCNGEGDRAPAVVIDRYGPVAVVRFDGRAIRRWADPLIEEIAGDLKQRGVLSVMERDSATASIRLLAGDAAPASVEVVEHGMRMLVDLHAGQKTGAFLDQRENRRRVRGLAVGARVLNLFSYTAGFSCAAALGGALHVTSVDSAQAAHATAQATFERNGIDPSQHAFVTADAFSFLDHAASRAQHWDIVISDPPSFAHNEKSVPRALGAYRKLHAACARVLASGGTLCAASCSSHVDAETFLQTLDDEALGRGRVVVSQVYGQPEDHPTVPGWPEGRYLKFVVLRC
jgi:23S rRNA (cytosine1962-C5)-methyltransferase